MAYNLPSEFLNRMQDYFETKTEYQAFLDSYETERSYGLRRNPLKYTKEEFEALMPYDLKEVPWCREGYFYNPSEKPGKSPYHENGSYYIQEPSAMEVVELLDPKPGQFVCDLCAAPGGKSSQIAGRLQGKGLLVSNEYVASRAQILAQNLERMGVRNCVVLNEDTERLRDIFAGFFHGIVIDAPCSGEGMFRKDEVAVQEWSLDNVKMCAERQLEILENGARMLRPGGVLVYSTCTFSKEENEDVITTFLKNHPEFEADKTIPSDSQKEAGIVSGGVAGTVRMWPHKVDGEGHFAAKLIKKGILSELSGDNGAYYATEETGKTKAAKGNKKKSSKSVQEDKNALYDQFAAEYLKDAAKEWLQNSGKLTWRGEMLYLLPTNLPMSNPELVGLKVVRPGLLLGEAKKNRFEPSHTLAMCLKKEDVKQSQETDNPQAYMHGETVTCENQKGWTLVLYKDRPMGWGKANNGVLKNHYPKGLRK